MESDTTTSDAVDSGVDDTQLDDTDIQTAAVNEDEDTSQTSNSDDDGSSDEGNPDDAELMDWAAKKNLPLDDPLKIAKMYRDAEKQIGKQGNKEGQLKQAVSTANENSNTEDYQALKNEVEALSFWVNHPGAKEQYEDTMVDILEEKPWLASDLDSVLDIAKGRSMTDAQVRLAERQAGKKEARADAEKLGRAAQPRASATNRVATNAKINSDNVEQIMSQHMGDKVWYDQHLPEINAALQG